MTVKVPGKRPPRAVAPAGPSPVPAGAVPGVNGLSKELTAADSGSTGISAAPHEALISVHIYMPRYFRNDPTTTTL